MANNLSAAQSRALNGAKTIKEINDQFDYKDEYPGGKKDPSLVACGQDGDYNELSYIYKTYLRELVEKNDITLDQAIQSLAQACKLSSPRKREDFYKAVSEHIGFDVFNGK